MSIQEFLENISLEELDELRQKKLEIEGQKRSYGFSSITDEILDNLFQIEREISNSRFQKWFSEAEKLEIENRVLEELEDLLQSEGSFLFDYQEEDLKIYFISTILKLVNFRLPEKRVRGFFEQKITYSNSRGVLNGTVDFVVAKGRKQAIKPYFFIQEFKQHTGASDPEPQLVAELIAGLELTAVSEIWGAYIVGNDWKFIILEKIEKDSYKYFVSQHFDSLKIEDLKNIYRNLLVVKKEILDEHK
jgi:hypothetical protein